MLIFVKEMNIYYQQVKNNNSTGISVYFEFVYNVR